MGFLKFIKRCEAKLGWFGLVLLSICLSEGVIVLLSFVFQGSINSDFVITGLAASFVVASLFTTKLVYLTEHVQLIESEIQKNRQTESLAEQASIDDSQRFANTDPLTGLPNREVFSIMLKSEIRKSQQTGELLAVIAIDVGNLRDVNNGLGHSFGDKVLVEAGKRIKDRVRGSDATTRLSGNEFALFLTKISATDHIERVANDLLGLLKLPYHLNGEAVYLVPSLGISVCPHDSAGAEELLANASQAVYATKNEGGNAFGYYAHSNQEAHIHKIRLVTELHAALKLGQFQLYFQPIVELKSGNVPKCEVLLRWHHPNRGKVGPLEFIPAAEETGLIHDIGDWVFRESLKFGKRWSELKGCTFKMGVNISPVQFKAKGLYEKWAEYLERAELPPQSVIFEITEGVLMQDGTDIHKLFFQLQQAGIQVAIDDFGTGYSSLSYLKKYDIDYLKIDRSFVRNITQSSSDKALSEAIVSMAHKLGLQVIAEGIETQEQKDYLCSIGCDYGQGYYFSRPIPSHEFERLLLGASSAERIQPIKNMQMR